MNRLLALLTLFTLLLACSCSAAPDEPDSEPASEDALAVAPANHDPTCTVGATTFTVTAYEAPEMTLTVGARVLKLPGETVAFRKRRYANAQYRVDVYKGLGRYQTFLFDARSDQDALATCVME